MAAQALYRRWRSRTFEQIIGQDHVTHTLLNALRAGRVGHAYLFAGPRGTGKTTTARVLARAVNCLDPQNGEPCNRCNICRSLSEGRSLDLIEIDAASNRGIDEIRALRERIAFSPSECRYKVYVIDEVHMLTNEAFNALLKTLEEPPPHAIFIMATTDPQRIPLTVLSRCQRFDFHRIPVPSLKQKLALICQQENIRIQPSALDAIARHATGSFRDAESLLDQLVSFNMDEITVEAVRRLLGSAPEEVIAGIVQSLIAGEVGAGLKWINEALDSGVQARQLTRELLEYLRGLLLVKSGGVGLLDLTPEMLREMTQQAEGLPLGRLLRTARLFNGAANLLKSGVHSQLPLELAFVEAALPDESLSVGGKGTESGNRMPPTGSAPTRPAPGTNSVTAAHKDAPATPTATSAHQPAPPAANADPAGTDANPPAAAGAEHLAKEQGVSTPQAAPADSAEAGSSSEGAVAGVPWLRKNWGRVLQAARPRSRQVEAFLKDCEPVAVEDDAISLGFYHGFHRERVNEDRNRKVVQDALAEVLGRAYRVKCVLYAGNRQEREQETAAGRREELLQNPVVREAIEEFGATVLDVQ